MSLDVFLLRVAVFFLVYATGGVVVAGIGRRIERQNCLYSGPEPFLAGMLWPLLPVGLLVFLLVVWPLIKLYGLIAGSDQPAAKTEDDE